MVILSAETKTLKPSNVNLLILTSSFPQKPESHEGGFIFELTKRINCNAFRPFVLCPHFCSASISEWWSPVRIFRFRYFFPSRFEQLAYGSGMTYNIREKPAIIVTIPFFIISEFLFSIFFIKKEKISLIHTHWILPQGLIGSILHLILNIPHITTIHGSDLNILKKHHILHPLCRFTIRNADIVTVNSRFMQRQLAELVPSNEGKIRIIPMGIDLYKFSPFRKIKLEEECKREKRILYVGRLVDIKGVKYLIAAMPEILRHHPDAILRIIGSGPDHDSLVMRAIELGLEENIQFLGTVNHIELSSYYQWADMFVLPSINIGGITEAFGVVLLEAMASGCPVIASNVGGIPDIITNGENGFLVPERDPASLAEKIVTLLSDTALAEQFRQAGYDTVQKRFSWDVVSHMFSEVYEEIHPACSGEMKG